MTLYILDILDCEKWASATRTGKFGSAKVKVKNKIFEFFENFYSVFGDLISKLD